MIQLVIERLLEGAPDLGVAWLGIGIFLIMYCVAYAVVTLALKFKWVNNVVRRIGFEFDAE